MKWHEGHKEKVIDRDDKREGQSHLTHILGHHKPPDAVLSETDIEIDLKSQSAFGQFQMADDLCIKNRVHLNNGFQFANHKVFDKNFQPVSS
jgi:hypothetical protein